MESKCQKTCLNPQFIEGTEWSVLSPEEIQHFNENAICRTYEAGEAIFYEEDDCKGLYLVKSGLVGVRKVDAEGGHVLLRLANPGDTLGYRPLLAGEKHRAGAEVLKTATVCFLPKIAMRHLLISNPELGAGFLQRTAQALGAADDRFFKTVTLPARIRFIHLLMIMRERCGRIVEDGSLYMELPLTRRDIASMLGIRAESLSRLVHEIEAEGLIHFSGNLVTVSNPDQLLNEIDAGLHFP
ncbi:MAG: Crp/Fnr family transcriptional regulator [Rhodospirillaceae bacterium]|nr:Crp/Fnr family transcriptional regulator [Rhodospirillaceae bacterium]MBL6941948.1 Crp/Fnr family transcriptional regulator [Rhodospirillales bacterium]